MKITAAQVRAIAQALDDNTLNAWEGVEMMRCHAIGRGDVVVSIDSKRRLLVSAAGRTATWPPSK